MIKKAKSKHDWAFAASSTPGEFPRRYSYRTQDVAFGKNKQLIALQRKRAKIVDYYENYYDGDLIYNMINFTQKRELTNICMCYYRNRITKLCANEVNW